MKMTKAITLPPLVVKKNDAKKQIIASIKDAQALIKQILVKDDFDSFQNNYKNWVNDTTEKLNSIFGNSTIAHDFLKQSLFKIVNAIQFVQQNEKTIVKLQLEYLKALKQQI